MEPTLSDGDWLLVDPAAYRSKGPAIGELVVAEGDAGLVVKRVTGSSPDGALLLSGDALSSAAHVHDLIAPRTTLAGRPWFCYWPPGRIGRIS
jgi:signal peptidase I